MRERERKEGRVPDVFPSFFLCCSFLGGAGGSVGAEGGPVVIADFVLQIRPPTQSESFSYFPHIPSPTRPSLPVSLSSIPPTPFPDRHQTTPETLRNPVPFPSLVP